MPTPISMDSEKAYNPQSLCGYAVLGGLLVSPRPQVGRRLPCLPLTAPLFPHPATYRPIEHKTMPIPVGQHVRRANLQPRQQLVG